MPIGSNNEFPSILIKEGTAPATPAAGDQRLFIDSADHTVKVKNSGGTVSPVGSTGGGAMTAIQTITNGSTSAMTFSSIPGTYKHLLLILQARAASASGVAYQLMQFNGDTGANYVHVGVFGLNAAAAAYDGTGNSSIRCAYLPDTTATANMAGVAHIWIPNYAGTSFFKSTLSQTFGSDNATAADLTVLAQAGQWASTAAITQIVLVNTMLTASTATLYGLSS